MKKTVALFLMVFTFFHTVSGMISRPPIGKLPQVWWREKINAYRVRQYDWFYTRVIRLPVFTDDAETFTGMEVSGLWNFFII